MKFHHIGVATDDFEKELKAFQIIGYEPKGEEFEEETQGMRGLFLEAPGQPRLELIGNLGDSGRVDVFLKNKIKMYHFAYMVKDVESKTEELAKMGARVISQPKRSVGFGKMVSFLVLPNRFMIELIEE